MGRLAELVGQPFQRGQHANVLGPGLVVGERQLQEVIAEHIPATPVQHRESRPPQGHQRAMDRGLRAVDRARETVQADPLRMLSEFAQHRQNPIRADEPRIAIARRLHVPDGSGRSWLRYRIFTVVRNGNCCDDDPAYTARVPRPSAQAWTAVSQYRNCASSTCM